MPIYAYDCTNGCTRETTAIRKWQDRQGPMPCKDCGSQALYAGLQAPAIIQHHGVAAIMEDGTRVTGNFNKTPPKKRPVTSKGAP